MKVELGRVVILVDDYDKAFNFYRNVFGGRTLVDYTTDDGQRFLHIVFWNENVGIWFLNDDSKNHVGNQTNGQPALVFYTDDLKAFYERAILNGVRIKKEIEAGPGYQFFHLYDLYGNEIVVVELRNQEITS